MPHWNDELRQIESFGAAYIQGLINEAVARKEYRVVLPPETFVITPTGIASGGHAIVVPSGMTIEGAPGHKIIQTGLVNPTHQSYSYNVFGVLDGSSDITFRGLNFEGENTPFSYVFNHQSACIDIRLTNTEDVLVENCTFRNLWGFSIHDRGANWRTTVRRCRTVDCSNGINVNSIDGTVEDCRILNSEGIESSAAGMSLRGNKIRNAIGVGISIGGATTPGAIVPGVVVEGNTIDGCVGASGVAGVGIVLADGLVGAVISGNTIRRTASTGITVSANTNPVRRCTITGNTIQSAGADGVGSVGMDLGSEGGHAVTDNVITNEALAGFNTKTALIVRCQKTLIKGNVLSGTLRDLQVTATATGSVVGENVLINGTSDVQI